jgi:D-glycero-beta-D-manno-heptose 1-phosphate adenylyltransferase
MQNKLQLIESKIYTIEALSRLVNQWHMMSKKVVFTNGVFDIMHKGHNTYLLQAAECGNRLIVAVNSDASTKRLKGNDRPIMDQYSRAFNLASHTYVDAVILFEEDTPMNLITNLKPDVLAKGGDYTIETVVGSKEVIAYGGSVEIIPFLAGYSTTHVIAQIQG